MPKLPKTFCVIPADGKRPLVRWQEYTSQHPSEEEKSEWEKQFPNANEGVVCGSVSGIFVLDEDGIVGAASLMDYEIPKTWTVKTPHGRHYYFQYTPELVERVTTKTDIIPNTVDDTKSGGVDVRGEGGFVAFYGWELGPASGIPLAKPPQWLVELLPLRDRTRSKVLTTAKEAGKGWLATKLASLKEGNRNETFTSIAGSLRSRGYESPDIYELLLPSARGVGTPDAELRSVCESVGRYEAKALPANEDESSDVVDFLRVIEPVEWLCEPIIAKGSFGFVSGPGGSAKTWILMDLAVQMAKGGGKWLGLFPVPAGKVSFFDQERPRYETQRRFNALIKGQGLKPEALRGMLSIKSKTKGWSGYKIDEQASYESLRRYLDKERPTILIVDSFVSFHSQDENSRSSIQPIMEKINLLRTEYGTAIVFIDHDGKGSYQDQRENVAITNERQMGSVAKPNASEFVLTVRKELGNTYSVYHTKVNMSEPVAPFTVKVINKTEDKSEIVVLGR